MMPFDAYRCYLSLKNHFTKDHYDYIKYHGKTRATHQAFYKRKDRFWFEKFSRQKNDKEVVDFFVSNFIYSTDPSTMWIGEMIKEGEGRYQEWQKKVQSLTYIFKEEVNTLLEGGKIDEIFDCSKGHPLILKSYLSGNTSLETMVICDRILEYRKDWDKKLNDPVWETVSRKIKKYSPFLNIDVPRYKKILKDLVLV
tara:strand:- start:390 stop:980 length:591 start_codon:yes stop_codon:yes gene_type:complete